MTYSVIIPAYNCEKTLVATIESILNSGLKNPEILIVNDGSTDGTASLCNALAQEYEPVRCMHQKNGGVSAARNRALAEANGDYVLFFDADDTVDEGALLHAAEIVEQEKPDILVFGMSFDYYHKGKLYRRDELVCDKEGLLSCKQWKAAFADLYDCNALTPVCNKLYRRAMLQGITFRTDYALMEDFLFVLECLLRCKTMYCQPKAIYRYRQAEDEGNAGRRLAKIDSLTEFVQPFAEKIRALNLSNGTDVMYRMLFMLMRQKMYKADIAEIRKTAEDFLNGPMHIEMRGASLSCTDKAFVSMLEAHQYAVIRGQNIRTQMRHGLAVAVKQTTIYQKLSAGDRT